MPFQPGNTLGKGNRRGTGNRQNFAASVRDFMAAKQDGKIRLHAALQTLYDDKDFTLLFAYGFGRPTETIEMSGPDGQPLVDPALVAAAAALKRQS